MAKAAVASRLRPCVLTNGKGRSSAWPRGQGRAALFLGGVTAPASQRGKAVAVAKAAVA